MEQKRTRLTAYIVAVYGAEVLEQIKKGSKQVLFNGTVVKYDEKFRDKRVTESTKIEITDNKIEDQSVNTAKPDEKVQTIDENKEAKEMATVIKADGTERFPTPVGSQYLDETLSVKATRNTTDMIVPDDAKTGEYQGTNKSDEMKDTKVDIEPETKRINAESESYLEASLKDAKTILTLHAAGMNSQEISWKVRVGESRVKEIINQGIDKTETQLREWYNMAKKTSKETKVKDEPAAPVKDEAVETTTETPTETAVKTGTRIKGGVALAEAKIVEILKEKGADGMPVKDLKKAAPEGVNPSTWVIRISKLKTAGKITVDDAGVARAV